MKAIDILARRGQRFANLRRIESLDPTDEADLRTILDLTAYHEFPFEYVQGTSIAFMRDYGVPTISDLLDRTGQFEHDGQKRYDDTNLFAHEAAVEGIESQRARAAVRKMNRIHGAYGIPNHEFRYVLATTLVGPKRFIDAYGYRPLHPHEVTAMTWFTTRFGQLMGIKELPVTYDEYERLLEDYETEHFAYSPANTRVAEASIRIVAGWYPRPLRPLVRRSLIAMLDEPLRDALGLPRQPRWLSRALHRALVMRGRLMRHLPPRRSDDRYVHDARRTYPFGYTIADLGPRDHSREVHTHAPARASSDEGVS
ncbi:oxygenase MpaB family protein [Nocardioides phosphati]|nr:oxygenase MpaB family protein [Nocardioides phosphati]